MELQVRARLQPQEEGKTMDDLFTTHAQLALRDAWGEATESRTGFEIAVDELSEIAKEEGKVGDWETAIKALKRAESAAGRAADAVGRLMAAGNVEPPYPRG
jgi:hypothetical protein